MSTLTTVEVFELLHDFGAELTAAGERLHVVEPPGGLPEIAWRDIAEHKAGLIKLVEAGAAARGYVHRLRLEALESKCGAARLPRLIARMARELKAVDSELYATEFDFQRAAAIELCKRHGIHPDATGRRYVAGTDAGAAYRSDEAKEERAMLACAVLELPEDFIATYGDALEIEPEPEQVGIGVTS